MTEVFLEITGVQAAARKTGLLTAGMVGVPVSFSFSPEWEGLNLLAVFRAGEVKKDYEIVAGKSRIPGEVMMQPGAMLCIGVEGRSKNGDLVIPTVWAEVGRILEGAYAAGDPALAPTPSQYERFMAGLAQVDEKVEAGLHRAKESGEFDGTSVTHRWVGTALEVTSASGTTRAELKGEPGYTPVKGVDYYTEEEKQELAEVVWVTSTKGNSSHNLSQIQTLAESGKLVVLKTDDEPECNYYLQDAAAGQFARIKSGEENINLYYASVNSAGEVRQWRKQLAIDAVRWYATQILSEEFKATARSNIGAAAEEEVIKTVNGVAPDANGNVEIQAGTAGGAGAIPAFDLMAMGMPPASFEEEMDWVQADVTALCSALDSGPVKLKFAIGMGEDQLPVWITAQTMCIPDVSIYLVSSQVHMEGAILMLSLEIDKTANQFRMVLSVLGA